MGMNCTRYNPNCNGKVRWDEDGDGAGVGDGDDDNLDDARDDGDSDGICLLERSFPLCRFPPRSGSEKLI